MKLLKYKVVIFSDFIINYKKIINVVIHSIDNC